MTTGLSLAQIKKLYKRFRQLDKDGNGLLSREELVAIPELSMNPLSGRLLDTFGCIHDAELSFTQFAKILGVFLAPDASYKEKLEFAFRVYDVDGDGFIGESDLFQVLSSMVGSSLEQDQIRILVKKAIANADENRDGQLSFEEFSLSMKHLPHDMLQLSV